MIELRADTGVDVPLMCSCCAALLERECKASVLARVLPVLVRVQTEVVRIEGLSLSFANWG